MYEEIIERPLAVARVERLIKLFPVTAILGPRQCGKTTLAKRFAFDHYFDLENPRDLARLDQPQLALEDLEGLVVIDEIHRKPELFQLLRYLVDTNRKQRYLILGSASRDLIQQSSESLAGRIGHSHLGGLSLTDVGSSQLKKLWVRGGLPLSFTAIDDESSILWREQYITTFLERDIPQLGIRIPAHTLRRFWIMLSHYHAQTMNYSEMARSFGISDMTVRKYIDILEGTFMIRTLRPWHENVGKRLKKAPKIYLRDSGIFHTLQSISSETQLLSHNKLGASFEGFCIEQIINGFERQGSEFFYWGTHSGAEVDLFWHADGMRYAVEIRYADAPRITKSMRSALDNLKLEHLWVVYPGNDMYKLDKRITALPLSSFHRHVALNGAIAKK